MKKKRVPQYLHRPTQLLWFEADEILAIGAGYFAGVLFEGYVWLAMVALPWAYIRAKRRYPRGFLRHALYAAGFYRLDGVPSPYVSRFYE